MEGDLIVTVERDLFQVLVPDLARVAPEVLGIDAVEAVPRALHVFAREGLAVVPAYTGVQLEGELGARSIPGPAVRQLRHNGVKAVAWLSRIEADQVVEDRHERHVGGNGRFLVDRRTGRLGSVVDAQCATGFLRRGGQHAPDQQLSRQTDGRGTAKVATPEQRHPHLLGQAASAGACASRRSEPGLRAIFSAASNDSGGRGPPSRRRRRHLSSSAATSLRSCDRSPAVRVWASLFWACAFRGSTVALCLPWGTPPRQHPQLSRFERDLAARFLSDLSPEIRTARRAVPAAA